MTAPFEGLFGETSELRVIQFLLPLKGLEFNISELARGTGVSRQTMISVVKKLTKWGVLKLMSRHGNARYYAINDDSGFIEAFEALNNCIVEQMLGAVELAQIANYSIDHSPVSVDAQRFSQANCPASDCTEEMLDGWSALNSKDRIAQKKIEARLSNSEIKVNLGENHAVAA